MKGIQQAVIGNRLGMVSNAIQTHAEKHGFSVVKESVVMVLVKTCMKIRLYQTTEGRIGTYLKTRYDPGN